MTTDFLDGILGRENFTIEDLRAEHDYFLEQMDLVALKKLEAQLIETLRRTQYQIDKEEGFPASW